MLDIGKNISNINIAQSVQLTPNPKSKKLDSSLPKSKQSANALFTFMNKIDYLKNILKTKLIFPRYCRENIEYLKLDNLTEIAFPMKCFCDIFINKLYTHMNLYGKYGIALSKEWGLRNKIQPVQYINNSSFIIDSIKDLYDYTQNIHQQISIYNNHIPIYNNRTPIYDNIQLYKNLQNILYDRLRFIKPLYGKMYREGNLLKNLNFHDEHEWRYILKIDDDNIYPYITEFTDLVSLSNDLTKNPNYGLKICSDDIKYLIVKSNTDRKELIYFIMDECPYTKIEKYILISKILVFNELEVDW